MRNHYRPWFRPDDGRPSAIPMRPVMTPEQRERLEAEWTRELGEHLLAIGRPRYNLRVTLEI